MNAAEILAGVARYHEASSRRLHLIPSENTISVSARLPYLTDLINRYCFPTDGENWAWPGNSELVAIERGVLDNLKHLFRARHVNVKPISGLNCMTIMLSTLAATGGVLLSIAEKDGGHGSTKFIARQLGLRVVDLPFDPVSFAVEATALARLARDTHGPKLIYLDQFMCLFPHDLRQIRDAVGPDAVIHYDGSHVLGLIAGGQFQDPLREGADSLAGSTHKSFPGPHKGVILTDSDDIARRVDEHASRLVSHHHPADVVALALATAETREDGGRYAAQVIRNARRFAGALNDRGFVVCGATRGYTCSHQVWVDIAPVMEPPQASRILLEADIVVNAIDIPYLATGVGLRLGVQEVTREGMDEVAMDELADIFGDVLLRRESAIKTVRRVRDLKGRYAKRAAIKLGDAALVTQFLAKLIATTGMTLEGS